MSAGTPFIVTSDGANHNNGVAGALTTAAVPVGALIVAAVNNPSHALLTSFQDSGGLNTYLKAVAIGTPADFEWWYCPYNTATLSSGSQFTGASAGTQWSAAVYAVTGATAGFDVSTSGSLTTTGTLTMNTATLSNVGEIAFAGFNPGTSNVITDPNWTTLSTGFTAYKISASTTALTNTITLGTAANLVGAIAVFKPSPVAAGTGIGAAPGIGAAFDTGVGSAAGAGTAPGISLVIVPPVGKIYYGVCLAVDLAAIPATVVTGTGLASGLGTAKAFSRGYGTGLAAGTGAALAIGKNTGATVGIATGIGTAPAISRVLGIGLAAGIGAAPGIGAGANVGLAAGFGAAPGIGGATGSAHQIANIPFNQWQSIPVNTSVGFFPGGTQGVQSNGVWALYGYWFNFPNSNYYTFSIPACCTAPAPAIPGNSLMMYVDQFPLQTSIGTTANRNWFCQFINNVGTPGTGPFVNYKTVNVPVTAGYHVMHITMGIAGYYRLPSGGPNTDMYCDSMIITDTGIPIPPEPAPQIRNPGTFPYSSYHFVNTPFSIDATFTTISDPGTAAFVNNGSIALNISSFSTNTWYGTASHPTMTILPGGNTEQSPIWPPIPATTFPARLPPGVYPSFGSDGGFCGVDMTNPRYRFNVANAGLAAADTINSGRMVVIDSYNLNHASPQTGNFSAAFIITQDDLNSGSIDHRMGMGMGFSSSGTSATQSGWTPSLQTSDHSGMPFPACESDAAWNTEYGTSTFPGIPYGATLGIPQGVAIDPSLSGNAGGTMLWKAFQNYGAYCNVTSGTFPSSTLFMDFGVNGPLLAGIRSALGVIKQNLRILTSAQPIIVGKGFGGTGNPVVSIRPGIAPGSSSAIGNINGYPTFELPPYSFPSNNRLIPICSGTPVGFTQNNGVAVTPGHTLDTPVNSFVFTAWECQGPGAMTYSTLHDSATNTYSIIQPTPNTTTAAACLAYNLKTGHDIPQGSNWTMNITGASLFFELIGVFYIPTSGSPTLHNSNTTTGTGTTFSLNVTANSGDLVIGFFYTVNGYQTVTDVGGFTSISSNGFWTLDFLLPSSNGPYTYSKSWNGGSQPYQAVVASFSGV